jgi:hypothetical protein
MLEHTGRRTGLARRVVLEVVDHPSPNTYLVASGFGTRSQWLRNIETNPNIRVWVGRHRALPANAPCRVRRPLRFSLTTPGDTPTPGRALVPVFEATLGGPVNDIPLVAIQIDPLGEAR